MNKKLNKAKSNKRDEFYTRYEDIHNELRHYDLSGKVVYCNCDDYRKSNFVKYLIDNFDKLNLKDLVATHYVDQSLSLFDDKLPKPPMMYRHSNRTFKKMIGDGDFRSYECMKLLRECDIVITNPPFSLFREFFNQLIRFNKEFIIIGHQSAVTYKNVLPFIQSEEVFLGHGFKSNVGFFINEHYEDYSVSGNKLKGSIRVSGVAWFTNVQRKEVPFLELTEKYNEEKYPYYDNLDVIEVSRTKLIPKDYKGVMGVPITFLFKHNPDQFRIIGANTSNPTFLNGNKTFKRIFIESIT